jgi:hypothetical protein
MYFSFSNQYRLKNCGLFFACTDATRAFLSKIQQPVLLGQFYYMGFVLLYFLF